MIPSQFSSLNTGGLAQGMHMPVLKVWDVQIVETLILCLILATYAGKTVGENLEDLPGLSEGQQIIMPLDKPLKKTGHLQILYGNLAPEGCVGKITGKEGLVYEGIARCFDSEEDMLAALQEDPNSFKVTYRFKKDF